MILTPTLLTLSATAGDYGIGAAIAGVGSTLFGLNRRSGMNLGSKEFGERMDAIGVGYRAVSTTIDLIEYVRTATEKLASVPFVAEYDDIKRILLSSSIEKFNKNFSYVMQKWESSIPLRSDVTEDEVAEAAFAASAKFLQAWSKVQGMELSLASAETIIAKASAENKTATDKKESAEATPEVVPDEVTTEEVVADIKSTAAAVDAQTEELPSITEVLDNAVKKSHEDFDNTNIVIL